jgi:hypothetical protein
MTRAHKTLSATERFTFLLHMPSVCAGLRPRADVAKDTPIVGYCTARPTEKAVGEAGVARVKAAKTGAGLWVGSVKAARPTEGYKTQSDKPNAGNHETFLARCGE